MFLFFRQILGAIILSVGLAVSPKLTKDEIAVSCKANSTEPLNFSMYAVVVTFLSTFFGILFILFFHTDYKRLKAEQEIDDNFLVSDPNTEDAKNIPNYNLM